MTPTVAHRKTNSSTARRRNHTPAAEDAGLDVAPRKELPGANVSSGAFSSPTLVESLAKGSLGSEIIARVVVSCVPVSYVLGTGADYEASPTQESDPQVAFYDFSA